MIVLGLLFFFNYGIIRLASQICCFLKAKQADVALQIYSGVNIFSPFFLTWPEVQKVTIDLISRPALRS